MIEAKKREIMIITFIQLAVRIICAALGSVIKLAIIRHERMGENTSKIPGNKRKLASKIPTISSPKMVRTADWRRSLVGKKRQMKTRIVKLMRF